MRRQFKLDTMASQEDDVRANWVTGTIGFVAVVSVLDVRMAQVPTSSWFSNSRIIVSLCTMLVFIAAQFLSVAAWACRENAMVVFDASGSMALFRDGYPKMVMARKAAHEVLPELTHDRPTGLVTYSGSRGPACMDIKLRVRPRPGSGKAIARQLDGIEPTGATPLSPAVKLAANTLKEIGPPGVIVLVTDGLENCGHDACALGEQLRKDSFDVKVHVISFYLPKKASESIVCLAKSTGGTYTRTESLEGLKEALRKTLSCPRISQLELGAHKQ